MIAQSTCQSGEERPKLFTLSKEENKKLDEEWEAIRRRVKERIAEIMKAPSVRLGGETFMQKIVKQFHQLLCYFR